MVASGRRAAGVQLCVLGRPYVGLDPQAMTGDVRMSEATVTLTWLGQAGFVLSGAGEPIVIDPWLSPHELRTAAPPSIELVPRDAGWLLCTHEHGDHLDLPSIPRLLERCPGLRIAVPVPLVARTREVAPGAEVIGVRPGDVQEVGARSLTVVPAWHGVTIDDGYSDGGWTQHGAPAFVGYVLRFPGLTVYHAGDTVASDALVDVLRPMSIDVALLPVNGRDFFREAEGILGNLDAREAVQLAGRIGCQILIPMHHDMVQGNTARVGAVTDHAADFEPWVHVLAMARGRSITLGPGD